MVESKTQNNNDKTERSFSFELVVALVIVIALLVFLVPTYFKYINIAKVTMAKDAAVSFKEALNSYKYLHKQYPADINLSTGKDSSGNT